MKVNTAYMVARNPKDFAYRRGGVSTIIGVKFVKKTEEYGWQRCFQVEFEDGVIDYIPISEVSQDTNKDYSIICMGKCD